MIKPLLNLLTWAFVRHKADTRGPIKEDEIEFTGKVPPPTTPKSWSCAILDTADMAVKYLGKPGLLVYKATVQAMEHLQHSTVDDMKPIYRAHYVHKAQAIWGEIDGEIGAGPNPSGLSELKPDISFPSLPGVPDMPGLNLPDIEG